MRIAAVLVVLATVGAITSLAQAPPLASPYRLETADPACRTAQLVSTGGPVPANPRTLAVRWAGYANFELVYNGQVVLLDAAFDRGGTFPPLGFAVSDVKRADAILIGHGHGDHMSDAAAVTVRTKAIAVGAPLTAQKLLSQSVSPQQIRSVTGRGGEVVELRGIRIDPILGRHSERDRTLTDPFEKVLAGVTAPITAEQKAEMSAINRRGVNDPALTAEGTITYLITLQDGFRVLFRDSAGDVTEFERQAMQRIGRVDLAIVALANAYLNNVQAQKAVEYVRVYRPGIFMPAHHDAPYNDLWRSTEPVFQVLKDYDPALLTISRGYREPVCFDTSARGR